MSQPGGAELLDGPFWHAAVVAIDQRGHQHTLGRRQRPGGLGDTCPHPPHEAVYDARRLKTIRVAAGRQNGGQIFAGRRAQPAAGPHHLAVPHTAPSLVGEDEHRRAHPSQPSATLNLLDNRPDHDEGAELALTLHRVTGDSGHDVNRGPLSRQLGDRTDLHGCPTKPADSERSGCDGKGCGRDQGGSSGAAASLCAVACDADRALGTAAIEPQQRQRAAEQRRCSDHDPPRLPSLGDRGGGPGGEGQRCQPEIEWLARHT